MPVSAATSAASMVSRSRISPTRMHVGVLTHGGLARNAASKPSVWVPTSRCDTIDFLFSCTNSSGSSMVMKCIECFWFISLMMAASVVDLPEPVGPVTSTRPERISTKR